MNQSDPDTTTLLDIEQLVQDDHNFNRGTEAGAALMKKSFEQFGAGRSVLVDKDNRIIAGNKSQQAAMAAGIKKVRIIETDGTELIAVKRTDIDLDSRTGRELAIADNATTQVNLSWDTAELQTVAIEQGIELPEWGLDCVASELSAEEEQRQIEQRRREFEQRMSDGELSEDDEEYQEFLHKFDEKKTTDDCYTPALVYDAVADWVANEYNVSRANFLRPFFPGGDYQSHKYKPTDIVVDNPPFSILSQIIRFYIEHGVRFFMFAPSMTLFSSSSSSRCTALPVCVTIIYENGALVNTSFVTNLEPAEIRVRTSPSLYKEVNAANEENRKSFTKQLPKYIYDNHIIISSTFGTYSRLGIDFVVPVAESEPIDQLDSQKELGKSIYGKGYILGERVVAERERAERERAERERAERWKLSEREMDIVRRLTPQG